MLWKRKKLPRKRKCILNKSANVESIKPQFVTPKAQHRQCQSYRIQTRSKQFLCRALHVAARQFTISRDVTWSSADVTTMDCSAVRIILDGRWDMSFTTVYVSCKRIQLWKLLRYEFLANIANFVGVIMISIFSDSNNVVRFNTRLTSLYSTSKTHMSVFLAVGNIRET